MKKTYLLSIIFMILLIEVFAFQQPGSVLLKSDEGGWSVKVYDQGAITKLDMLFHDVRKAFPQPAAIEK